MGQFNEGQRLKGSDGNIYVVRNGVPVMEGGSPAIGPTIGGDPRMPYQMQVSQGQAAAAPYEAPKAQAEAQIAAATAPYAGAKAQAEAAKAQAEARVAEAGGPKIDASQRAAAIQGYSFAKQLQAVVDDLNTKYNAGPGKTHGVQGFKDYLPYTQNQQFDNSANAARGIVGQTLGFTGGQLNTPAEAEQAIGPYLPHAGDRDEVIKDKINRLQGLAQEGRQKAIQILGGEPDVNGNVHPVSAAPAAQPPQGNLPGSGQDQMTLATGGTRDVVDPMLKAVGQKVGSMIAGGAPDAQIRKFLSDSGVNPANTSIDQALHFRTTPAFKQWQRANPGQAYPIGPNFYTKPVPMSGARSMFNKTAATDAGGAAAAYAAAAGNAISGGRLDNMADNPEMARTGMELLRANHPYASLAGDVSGYGLAEGSVARIPGAAGVIANPWGRRGLDALYGAYSGSGENDADPAMGAITGAAANLGGGMVGRGLWNGAGRAAQGVKNGALQYLDNAGVPLTIGRIGRGSDNVVGKMIGGLEERALGLPGFDAVIGAGRQRGDKGLNSAAFREAGGSGATGAAGLDEVGQLRNKAYSFLDNTNLPLDAQFAGSQAGVRAALPGLPAYGNEIGKSLNMLDNTAAGGSLAGRDWQSALRAVRGDRSSIKGKEFADHAVNQLDDVESNLLGLASRQGPADTIPNLNAANKLHGQVETLASALDNSPTQRGGQLFSASRLDDVSRVNARNFGGRMASLTGKNRPFYDLTQAGMEVMPNLTPDSGTAGRMLLVPLLTGAGGATVGGALGGDDRMGGAKTGLDYGIGLGLASAGPYSKVGQKALQKLILSDRPEAMQKLGAFLLKHPKYAGMFGSSLGRDYFYQPELGQ